MTAEQRSSKVLDIDPGELQQELLDGVTRDIRYAQSQVDALAEDKFFAEVMMVRETSQQYIPGHIDPQNVELVRYEWQVDAWIRYRDHLRGQATKLTNDMLRNGLHERVVRLREGQSALVFRFMEMVADAIGLSPEQRKALGPAMREHAGLLEGANAEPIATFDPETSTIYYINGTAEDLDDDDEEED